MASLDRLAARLRRRARGPDSDDAPPAGGAAPHPRPDPREGAEGQAPPNPEQEIIGPEAKILGPEPEILDPEGRRRSRDPRKKISRWVEKRATRIFGKVYEDRAEDLQQRAARTIGTVYEERADELEDRAVRAMRRAIEAESDRIRIAIEHGVAVKKREVRLSLLVLAVSSLVYVVLYFLTR